MVARTRAARRLSARRTLPPLPDELVQAVAHALCTAEGRAAMLRTCKAWQHAIDADPYLWKAIALRRFPCLEQVSVHLPGTSWPELLRVQLAATRPHPTVTMECKTSLDDYLVTYELMRSGKQLFSWTGPSSVFDEADWTGAAVDLWAQDEEPAAILAPDFAWDAEVQLRAFVTRRVAGTPLRMVQLFDLPIELPIDEAMVCFDTSSEQSTPMPCKGRHLTQLMADILGDDGEAPTIFARPWLNTETGTLSSCFRLDTAEDYLEMNRRQILYYLEHCVPWD